MLNISPTLMTQTAMLISGSIQKLAGYALSCCRRRQRPSVFFHDFYPFINDLTKLCINLRFIRAMATRAYDAGTLAHKTLILVRPFDDLHITRAFLHFISHRFADNGKKVMLDYLSGIHRRVAENAEWAQRGKPLRNLCVLCDSAVKESFIIRPARSFHHYRFANTAQTT